MIDLQTKRGRLGITLTNQERVGLAIISAFGLYLACMGSSILLALFSLK